MKGLNSKLRSLYPFHSHCLNLNGLLYHYIDEGHYADEGKGNPIVMVHGNPSWSFLYRRLVQEFSSTHRVLVPDHIGCGLSDKPQDYSYTLKQHVANLEAFIEKQELKNVTLMLHDWGGPIGLGYATNNVDNISSIIAMNTVGFVLPHIPWYLKLCGSKFPGEFLVRRLNAFAKCASVVGSKPLPGLKKLVKEGYLAPYDSYENRIAIHRFIRDIPKNEQSESYEELKRIEDGLALLKDTPMLLLWGAKDPVFRMSAYEAWQKKVPHLQTELYSDGGHYLPEDCHEEIVPRIRSFLSTIDEVERPQNAATQS